MIVGYFLEQALGLVLAVAVLLSSHYKLSRYGQLCPRALDSFNDCATFFAFSIEIAAIVVLVREDFGISTSGMGDATVHITQAISVLVLLPLCYRTVTDVPQSTERPETDPLEAEKNKSDSSTTASTAGSTDEKSTREARCFILLVVCWLLAFYPFYSKMNTEFGPSQISSSGAITSPQFAAIEDMCTANVSNITSAENAVMTAFEMVSYILLSVFVLGRILWLGMEKHHSESKLYTTLLAWCRRHVSEKVTWRVRTGCLIAMPLLASGLVWTILRTQQFQHQMARTMASDDSDAQWTFGQVVAVTVFAPVIVEGWSAFQDARLQVDVSVDSGDSLASSAGAAVTEPKAVSV